MADDLNPVGVITIPGGGTYNPDLVPVGEITPPAPAKPRGMVSAFGAGVEGTVGEAAQAVGNKTGLNGVEQWGKNLREKAAPVGDESLPVSTARALGGLAGWLPTIIGGAALIPETPELAAGTLLGAGFTAARVAAGAAASTAATKITEYSDLRDKGVDADTADKASWTAAAANAAGMAVPMAKTGGLLTRMVSGGLAQAAFGEGSRELQNKILESHPELQSEFSAKNAITNFAVGAAMGGILGPRPIKDEIAAMKDQAEADVANGAPTEKPPAPPAGAAPTPEQTATNIATVKAGWDQMLAEGKVTPQQHASKMAEIAQLQEPRAPAPFELQPSGEILQPTPAEPAPGVPEKNSAQADLFALKPAPTRTELSGIADFVLGEDHAISKQAFAQVTKGADSVEAVADNLRTRADAIKDPGIKSDLQELADHLSPRGDTNALPVESTGSVLQHPQKGLGEAGSERQRVESVQQGAEVATEKGNGPATKRGKVNEEATQAESSKAQQPEALAAAVEKPAWGVHAMSKILADAHDEKPSAEIKEPKVDATSVSREAELTALKTQRDLTPTEHRELVALKTDNEEARAWAEAKDRADAGDRAGEAFASKTVEQAKNPATRDEIHTEAAKIFGSKAAADRLIVHVTNPEKQIPASALAELHKLELREDRPITVAFARDGKIYVMDNQIEKGSERAIILHEAGVHIGMEKLIGTENFSKLVEQIRDWSNGNGHMEDIALARKTMQSITDRNVPPAYIEQETVAYFVQHALEAGINPTHLEGQLQSGALVWMRKIWATMRAALQRLGVNPASLKAQDIVDIAHAAAIAHAEGIPGEHAKTTDFRSNPETLRSVRLGFATPTSAAKTVDALTSKATSAWDSLKPALQRAHLNWSQMTHIADMTENLIPRLAQWGDNAINPVRDKVNNMLASGAIAKELNHAAQGIYDKMQALEPKQKEALVQLMGKYQLAKVFPNLNVEDHTWLKPEEKALYREAKQLYSQPGVAEAYDAARLHNQRLHDTGMAAMLKSMAQIYGVPEPIWRAINVREGMSKNVTALLNHVKASDDHTLQDHFSTAMNLHEAKKTESYFSLGRDGDYMVNFHIKDTPEAHAAVQKALGAAGVKDSIVVNPGDTHVFSMFETMNQMLSVTKQLDTIKAHLEPSVGTDFEGKPTASHYTAGVAVEKLKALDSSAPSFIRGMLAKIDADPHLDNDQKGEQQELLRRMYINMLPESSVSKFYARRAGTPGYSSDMARSFVKRAAAGAYFTSQHATRPEQNVAMARLREAVAALGDAGSPHFDLQKQTAAVNVVDELNKRTANMLMPLHTPILDTASALGHAFYLSASPGFILQNLAQPYQLTLPYLGGRHGFRASSVAMGSAAKDVAKIIKDTIQQGWQGNKWTGVLDATITVDRADHMDQADKDALKHLIASGRADWTQGGQLTKIAEGSNRSLETALKTANSLSYYGEVLNRMQTGLAAYRLEMKRSNDNAKALDYMVRAVDDTQINYATENKARAIGKHGVFGPMTPMVMAFQQFNLGVLQLLGKLTMQAVRSGAPAEDRIAAAKSLGGIMAATGVAAGTMGLPFAGVVLGAYNALMGSENQPVDAKSDYQNFLSDIMGKDAAQVAAHGALNYLSGADVAAKLGQENVIPFTGLFSQMLDSRQPLKDRINSGALSFMGPVVNGGANVLQGLGKIADGDTMKGLEQMSPAMTKGVFKAADIASNGFTDSKGVALPMEETSWDTTVQAAGFTPTKLATQREAQQGVNAIQGALKMQEHTLANRFVAAVESHDVEARQQVMDEARAFMLANPGMRIDFAGAMRRRAQETVIAKATGGIKGRSSQIPMIEQQTRFAQP